ncbi:guanylate kinase [Caldicoprobacter guelmensis]|uniref:guanylate kinase n=1 Tax=Caldicoprobacter guelmensis TaxID=1170224 RepID=UPI00195EC0DC|nr:guanylate kinase [Caldicoprobacter guelmensis]
MFSKGLLIVVSGPSGAGKGTICNAYLERNPHAVLSVSVTTRKPRAGEKEGVNYFFRDKETFLKMVENGEFLEYAEVYGNYYGTPKKFVEEKLADGRDVILEIDIQGALQVKERFPEAVFIFVIPPSMEELKRRIVKRGTEDAETIYKRFQSAYEELNYISRYNYVILNDTVESAVAKLEAIVLAEKCRVDRNKELYLELTGRG